MENEEIKREQNADKNIIKQADNAESVETDELAQDFLNMRRNIQRMNHRRDAWTRR